MIVAGVIAAAVQVSALGAPQPAAVASTPVEDAIKVCEDISRTGAARFPSSAQFYQDFHREVGGLKPFEQVPALVKQFGTARGAGALPNAYVAFALSGGGSIWAVMYQSTKCDVMATGLVDPASVIAKFQGAFAAKGYVVIKSIDAAAPRILQQQLLLKRDPQPGMPNYGTRALFDALAPAASKPDGVQLSINFTSGEIQVPPAPPSTPTTPKP